jgi:predicted O-methyltransferase YrrM
MSPSFTSNWFGPMESIWLEHVAPRIAKTPNAKWLEVGSYEGRSALWILDHILQGSESHITCVDIWDSDYMRRGGWDNPNYEKLFDSNTKENNRITKIKGRAEDVLLSLRGQVFHGAYIDSSHTEKSVLAETRLTWNLLLPEAVLVLDDYGSHQHPGVKKATDNFLSQPDIQHEILPRDWQLIIVKKQNESP